MTDTTITPEERAELRELAGEATPRPWIMAKDCDESDHMNVTDEKGVVCCTDLYGFEYPEQWNNGRYIAAACNLAPRLLNALEAAEVRKEEAESSLARAFTEIGEMSAGIEKIAAANHALAEKAQQAEAENARLQKMVDWLAVGAAAASLADDERHRLREEAEDWKEAARRAVEGEPS